MPVKVGFKIDGLFIVPIFTFELAVSNGCLFANCVVKLELVSKNCKFPMLLILAPLIVPVTVSFTHVNEPARDKFPVPSKTANNFGVVELLPYVLLKVKPPPPY